MRKRFDGMKNGGGTVGNHGITLQEKKDKKNWRLDRGKKKKTRPRGKGKKSWVRPREGERHKQEKRKVGSVVNHGPGGGRDVEEKERREVETEKRLSRKGEEASQKEENKGGGEGVDIGTFSKTRGE